jgi:predicted CoA-binding protein
MLTQNDIKEFFSDKKLAIAGVSGDKNKFGYSVYKHLSNNNYDVCLINPNTKKIDDYECYKDVLSIPDDYKKLVIITKSEYTDELVRQAATKGIKHIWVQQECETLKTEALGNELGVKLIMGQCIFMFAEPIVSYHKVHKWFCKVFGALPKEAEEV